MALNNLGLGFLVTAKDAASAVFNAVGEAMGGTEKKSEKLRQTLGEASSELTSMGLKLAGFGVAGLAGLGAAANSAAEYNAAIAEVASITDRANFPIETMKTMTQEMALTYGGDLIGHVKSLYQAASSGATTAAEAQQLLNAANLLAVGGLSDSFLAVDALTNVVNAFGMSLDKTAGIADAMFVAVKVGKTDVNQLAQSIGDLAPIANLTGLSMDDMFSTVAAASNQLGSGTKAITGMRAALTAILDPTSKAVDEAKRLGITFTRAHMEAVGFPAFLKEITGASGYTVESLSKLFGSVEAVGAVAALTANGGKGLADAMDAMAHKAGAADAAFRTMADAAQFAEKRLKANLQVAIIKIGDVVLPVIEAVMRAVNSIVTAFNHAPPILQKVLVGVIAMASAGALAVGALLLLAGAVAAFVAIGEVAAVVLVGAVQLLQLFSLVAGAAGLAIVGFRAAVEQNVGGIGKYFEDSYKQVKLVFDAMVQLFEDGGFSGAVAEEFSKGTSGAEQFATQAYLVFNRVKNFFVGISEGFQAAIGGMGSTFAELVTALRGLGKALGVVQDGPKAAGAAFASFGAVGAAVGRGLAGVFELLAKAITAVVNFTAGLAAGFRFLGPVFGFVTNAVGALLSAFGQVGEAFGQIGGSTSSSTSAFEKLGNVVGVVAGVVGYAFGFIVSSIAAGVSLAAAQLNGLIGMFNGVITWVRGFADVVLGVFTGDWGRAFEGAKMIVYGFAQTVISMLSAMLASVGSIIDSVAKTMGVDLGLKAAFEGGAKDALKDFAGALGVSPGSQGPKEVKQLTVGPGAAAAPGAASPAAAGVAAAAAAAVPSAPLQIDPLGVAAGLGQAGATELKTTINLVVDGAVLAEVVAKNALAAGGRSFAPSPTAT